MQTTASSTALPEYSKPPVVEVACSLQFEPVDGLHAGMLGSLWQMYRERYGRVEEHPPLSAIRETFESRPSRIGIGVFPTFPMPRLWFLNDDGTRLIQVQRDHFIVNWRKLNTDAAYPRYESIRSILSDEYGRFQEFLRQEGLGETQVLQTELTYVNHIDARKEDGSRKPLSQIVSIWTREAAEGKLPLFEEASFQAHYIMFEGDRKSGRLHITMDPQLYVRDGTPVYSLTLIARGAPLSGDWEGALSSLNRGHEAIVNGFTAITSEQMHAVWERRQ